MLPHPNPERSVDRSRLLNIEVCLIVWLVSTAAISWLLAIQSTSLKRIRKNSVLNSMRSKEISGIDRSFFMFPRWWANPALAVPLGAYHRSKLYKPHQVDTRWGLWIQDTSTLHCGQDVGQEKEQAHYELRETQPWPEVLLWQERHRESPWQTVRVSVHVQHPQNPWLRPDDEARGQLWGIGVWRTGDVAWCWRPPQLACCRGREFCSRISRL